RVASAAAGLLLLGLLGGVIASTWLAHRAKLAKAGAEQASNDLRELARLRRINYYDALNVLPGTTRIRDGRALTSGDRHDLADVHNGAGSAIEGYRPTALENVTAAPPNQELAVDKPRDRTYRRTFPAT